jgi:hypothetical protein
MKFTQALFMALVGALAAYAMFHSVKTRRLVHANADIMREHKLRFQAELDDLKSIEPDPRAEPENWRRWWLYTNPGETWEGAGAAWREKTK